MSDQQSLPCLCHLRSNKVGNSGLNQRFTLEELNPQGTSYDQDSLETSYMRAYRKPLLPDQSMNAGPNLSLEDKRYSVTKGQLLQSYHMYRNTLLNSGGFDPNASMLVNSPKFEGESTYRVHYGAKKNKELMVAAQESLRSFKPILVPEPQCNNTFDGSTSYNSSYRHMQVPKPCSSLPLGNCSKLIPKQYRTSMKENRFDGETSYHASYKQPKDYPNGPQYCPVHPSVYLGVKQFIK